MAVCSRTVYVRRAVQVYAQYAPRRKRENEDIVGDCSCDEIGRYVELQRNALYIEHGKRRIMVVHVTRARRSISAGQVVGHGGLDVARVATVVRQS